MNVKGSVIWITGASSGIGEALAYELSKRGAKLILSARRLEKLEEVKENCHSEDVKLLPLDLAETNSLEDKAKSALELYGQLDILINNGGISQRSFVRETKIGVDETLMRVNYLGTVALTKAVLPHMRERLVGQIITISSMMGLFSSPLRSTYAATKHALHGFMNALRSEELRKNIKITIVCPGYVATDVSLNALTGDGSKQGTMDEATAGGLRPEIFAKKMVDQAILGEKREVIIAGFKEKLGLFLSRYFPNLYDRLVQKMNVT